MAAASTLDCYQILDVGKNASIEDIKRAYHRALLASHPDKRAGSSARVSVNDPSISVLKEAYTTLSSPELRAKHDADLAVKAVGPRPAAVLSLDDLTEGEGQWEGTWAYPCRCGGTFTIREQQMEANQHFVGCGSCSEVIWVGYELVEE